MEESSFISEDIFIDGLHSSEWKNRLHAVEELGELSSKHPKQTFSALFSSLLDKEPYVREMACYFLIKKIPKDLIINQLKHLLNGNDGMRWTGLMAAEVIKEDFLLSVLKNVNDPELLFQQRIDALIYEIEND